MSAAGMHVLLSLTVDLFIVPEWDVFRGRQHKQLHTVTAPAVVAMTWQGQRSRAVQAPTATVPSLLPNTEAVAGVHATTG
jgi:hypothetical protein